MRQIVFGFLFLSGILQASAHELALNWKPEPEFGGFYEAKLSGLYEQKKIKIEILPGGAGQPVAQMLAAKKVSFGIVSADQLILARAQGAKIVALFAVYQNSPQGIMVHASRHFGSLKAVLQSDDTLALQKGLPFSLWLEKKLGPIKAQLVPYTGGLSQFLRDPRYAQQCFATSEVLEAKRQGAQVQSFLFSEVGYNPYLTVVAVHEDLLKAEPQLVKDFLDATRTGWKNYLAHPEKTNAAMQKLNSGMSLASFNETAEAQKKFIETAETREKGLGTMSLSRFQNLYESLKELGLVKLGMNPREFFK